MRFYILGLALIVCIAGAFTLGYVTANDKELRLTKCFETCASLVLLTPDDPDDYAMMVKEVEWCANQE